MALIKLSSIGITSISGKAGGSVYSRNRGGAYVKNFVIPTNTFSDLRQQVRAMFGAISSAWRNLTEGQRNSWVAQAPNYPYINKVGDSKTLSGIALHNSLNTNLMTAGLPMIPEANAPAGTNGIIGGITGAIFDIGTGDTFSFSQILEEDNTVPNNTYVIEATPGVSASRNYVENDFRVITSTSIGTGTNPTSAGLTNTDFATGADGLLNLYTAKLGTPSVGDRVHFRIWAVNERTGEVSAKWYSKATVIST